MNIRFVGNTARHVLVALVALFAISSDAWAWGDQGHKVICEIAFRLVQPNTRAEIRKLISNDERFNSFTDSCTWPDHPRQRASEHFLNLPRDSDGLHSETCPDASACVVTAIKKDFDVLLSNNASQAKKLESLKFLGHWVGDIHQPLHVSFEDDRGGNSVLVTGLCDANLHSAWDACLVLKSGDRRGLCRGEHPRNRVSGSRICSMQLWASRCRATGGPHAESAFTRIAASLRGSGGR